MIRLAQAVVVEGKYDKKTLENIIDAYIITTDGFGIFKDKEKCDLIRNLSKKNGIIVMTDSDSAGAVIRSYLKNICKDGSIINVYIPQILGKEKRKAKCGKEGLLGVEGMTSDIIKQALINSGVNEFKEIKVKKKITKTDLYKIGLSGSADSSDLRKRLSVFLGLPSNLSANAFLDAVNAVYGYDGFFEEWKKWEQEADKN